MENNKQLEAFKKDMQDIFDYIVTNGEQGRLPGWYHILKQSHLANTVPTGYARKPWLWRRRCMAVSQIENKAQLYMAQQAAKAQKLVKPTVPPGFDLRNLKRGN